MKRLCLSKKESKQGVASLYVVVFATILFGVITLSFMRIILSEAEQSSEDDLSQSAYDAAMAGVEDAKRAVNQYYRCLSGSETGAACSSYSNANALFTNNDDADCLNGFSLANVLYGQTGRTEISIQETGNDGEHLDQAYTCVLIRDKVPDYRGTLTSDARTKVIPLAINRTGNADGTHLDEVQRIRFSWFSQLNVGNNSLSLSSGELLDGTNKTVPPVIQLTVIKTGRQINPQLFHQEDNVISGSDTVINSTFVLLPTSGASDPLTISWEELVQAGNASSDNKTNNTQSSSDLYSHKPFKLSCSTTNEFACIVEIEVGGNLHNGDNLMLVASLPYGDPYSDFAASLLDASGNQIQLEGVQVSVDSTGRTNQLLRRVEVRLDPADLFFPYPQYALELNGGDQDDIIKKYFWVTANCWAYSPTLGSGGTCDENGEIE